MKIKTIGTGGIESKNTSASTLVDGRILVDCGNGVFKSLLGQNVDIDKIDTILITHLHGDHFLDLHCLVTYRMMKKYDNELVIYCPRGTKKTIDTVLTASFSDLGGWPNIAEKGKARLQEFDKLENERITGDYVITSFPVIHGKLENCKGYVVEDGRSSVGFSGDSCYCDSIDSILKLADLAVLDTTDPEGNDSHMGVDDIARLASIYQDTTIVPTHMSDASKEELTKADIENVIVLEDGQEINI